MSDDEDFSQIDSTRQPKPTAKVKQEPYDPTRERESKRGWIALTLVFLFVILVAFLVVSVTCRWFEIDMLEKIGAILLNPVTVLVGTVVGFYFGEQRRPT